MSEIISDYGDGIIPQEIGNVSVKLISKPEIVKTDGKIYMIYDCRHTVDVTDVIRITSQYSKIKDIDEHQHSETKQPVKSLAKFEKRKSIRTKTRSKSVVEPYEVTDSKVDIGELDTNGITERDIKKPGKRAKFNGTIIGLSSIVNAFDKVTKNTKPQTSTNVSVADIERTEDYRAASWLVNAVFSSVVYNKLEAIFHEYDKIPDLIVELSDSENNDYSTVISVYDWLRSTVIQAEMLSYSDIVNQGIRKTHVKQRSMAMENIIKHWPNKFAIYAKFIIQAFDNIATTYDTDFEIPRKFDHVFAVFAVSEQTGIRENENDGSDSVNAECEIANPESVAKTENAKVRRTPLQKKARSVIKSVKVPDDKDESSRLRIISKADNKQIAELSQTINAAKIDEAEIRPSDSDIETYDKREKSSLSSNVIELYNSDDESNSEDYNITRAINDGDTGDTGDTGDSNVVHVDLDKKEQMRKRYTQRGDYN